MKKLAAILAFGFSGLQGFAQTDCDSVTLDVKYAAFYDSMLQINVINASATLFDYPGFIIYDANGDTVAKETVNSFGLGDTTTQFANVFPGMPASSAFTGSIELWTGFYSNLNCSYTNFNFDLCPDTCVTVLPYMINLGGAAVLGNFAWDIKDASSQIVASGTFLLDFVNQDDYDTICLNAGSYTLHVDSGVTTGGGPHVGMTLAGFNTAPRDTFYTWQDMNLPFQFYHNCTTPTSISEPVSRDQNDVRVYSANKEVYLEQIDHKELGTIHILNLSGQTVYRKIVSEQKTTISLSHLSTGIYLVNIRGEKSASVVKIFLAD